MTLINKGEKLVSVVIPTYNRAQMVCDCVDSVLAGDYSNLEIIIVDDASTDNTSEICMTKYKTEKRIVCIRNDTNVLTAKSRNNGLLSAHGDYVLFLDNDNIASADMISKLVRVLESDKSIGLAGALSVDANSNSIWTLGATYNFFTSRPVNLHEGENVTNVSPHGLYSTFYSPNASLVHTDFAKKIGGFDASYGMMYEEADFGYRLNKEGYRAVICADARTSHLGYAGKDDMPQLRRLGIESALRTYCFARNRTKFMRRFAPLWCLIGYHLFFAYAFILYYCFVALRNNRPDIAKAYFAGAIAGLFGRYGKRGEL